MSGLGWPRWHLLISPHVWWSRTRHLCPVHRLCTSEKQRVVAWKMVVRVANTYLGPKGLRWCFHHHRRRKCSCHAFKVGISTVGLLIFLCFFRFNQLNTAPPMPSNFANSLASRLLVALDSRFNFKRWFTWKNVLTIYNNQQDASTSTNVFCKSQKWICSCWDPSGQRIFLDMGNLISNGWCSC